MMGFADSMADQESGWGDPIRIVVAFLATIVLLAASAKPLSESWALVVSGLTILLLCVWTARNRWSIVLGVTVLVISRLMITGALTLLR